MPAVNRLIKQRQGETRKAQARAISDNIEREARRLMAEDGTLTLEQAERQVFADADLLKKCHAAGIEEIPW
jgi:hypothetical protein